SKLGARVAGRNYSALDSCSPVCCCFSSYFESSRQGLLMGVAGAALVLLLQEAVDPTPLFWTAPWEAMQLLLSRARRINHVWLHRTQELARESIGLSTKVDGFAMADGFVLIGV